MSRPLDPGRILDALRRAGRPLKTKEIARRLDVPKARYRDLRQLLKALTRDGTLYRISNGRFALPERAGMTVGRVETIRSGAAFVQPDGGGEDVFVSQDDLGSAMDGDRVAVRIEARPPGKRPSGRVIKVLHREHARIVGRYREDRGFGVVRPMGARLRRDVLIPQGREGEAVDGDVVVTDIDSYGDRRLPPVGRVSEVLGRDHDPRVDALTVLFEHALPAAFPATVTEAAERAAESGWADPGPGRRDRTDLLAFTIDPADARDHDDALSIERGEDGRAEVGVHIADVSHFVRAGGAVDLEALDRATSVYLVDRVVPMLPEALSAGVCSLVDGEDRLALSLFLTLDDGGAPVSHRFERTRIRSRASLSYRRAQEILDGKGEPAPPELADSLRNLAALAAILRQRRMSRGSLDFDLPEPKVVLDDAGMAVEILKAPRYASHRLIEEFMLLANETVARALGNAGMDPVYRIHARPDEERTAELRHFLSPFGLSFPRTPSPRDLQAVLSRVEGRPEETVVRMAVLRALMRARYDTENEGHFGLAMEDYVHFTSPIRRYPDLVTHRQVGALVDGSEPDADLEAEALQSVATHASSRERRADKAETDSVELARLRFMEGRLGDVFIGTVSRIVPFGFFVLLESVFVEGLVHVRTLADDYYEQDDRQMALVGSSRGRRFRMGQRVRVQVARVDRDRREIGFTLADDGEVDP